MSRLVCFLFMFNYWIRRRYIYLYIYIYILFIWICEDDYICVRIIDNHTAGWSDNTHPVLREEAATPDWLSLSPSWFSCSTSLIREGPGPAINHRGEVDGIATTWAQLSMQLYCAYFRNAECNIRMQLSRGIYIYECTAERVVHMHTSSYRPHLIYIYIYAYNIDWVVVGKRKLITLHITIEWLDSLRRIWV